MARIDGGTRALVMVHIRKPEAPRPETPLPGCAHLWACEQKVYEGVKVGEGNGAMWSIRRCELAG